MVCSIFTISENATPKNLQIGDEFLMQLWEARVPDISLHKYQHSQCDCWSITKRGNSELVLNILHSTYHLAVNMWSWSLFQIPILSKFISNLSKTWRAIIFPENTEFICVYVFQERERESGTCMCSLKVKVVKW